jgi:hypothetical protein
MLFILVKIKPVIMYNLILHNGPNVFLSNRESPSLLKLSIMEQINEIHL